MGELLMFNIEKGKAIKIKNLCRKLYIEAREIQPEDYGKKLSFLLGISNGDEELENTNFTDEMLYFSDFGGMLSIFLDMLKRKKLGVDLKAVRTDTNISFTPSQLHAEIAAEREAIANGRRIH